MKHEIRRSKAELASVRFHWNRFAKEDPLWAVLTRPEKRGRRWQHQEFFATGEVFIDELRRRFEALGMRFEGMRALDFGCGVGRLTRPLTRHFRDVVGLDVAEHMLEVAREFASGPGVTYLHSPAGDLSPVHGQSFDCVMTHLTLQHVPPTSARRLERALCAVVAPRGLLFLQIPSESRSDFERLYGRGTLKGLVRSWLPPTILERYRTLRTRGPRMDMFGLPRAEVESLLHESGLKLLAVDEIDDAGESVPSFRYLATR